MVRAKIEVLALSIFAFVMLLTAVWPTWIESVFDADPDGGSGALEWAITSGCGVLALAALVMARFRWVKASYAD